MNETQRFTCFPGNLLVQTSERVRQDQVVGKVFVYVDGCLKPKDRWPVLAHDGALHWSGHLSPAFPAYIDDLMVNERHKGRGLGSLLVSEAEKRISALGITRIQGIALEGAEDFWERRGYEVDRETSWFVKRIARAPKSRKEPLYPHMPKQKKPLYPHRPAHAPEDGFPPLPSTILLATRPGIWEYVDQEKLRQYVEQVYGVPVSIEASNYIGRLIARQVEGFKGYLPLHLINGRPLSAQDMYNAASGYFA